MHYSSLANMLHNVSSTFLFTLILLLSMYSIEIISLTLHPLEIVPERIEITYANEKYVKNIKAFVRRNSRRSPYLTHVEADFQQELGNNVSLSMILLEYLHNEYRRSFVEFHFKLCDYINKDDFIGIHVRGKGIKCPISKMCQSLFDGETTYTLQDVNAMRGRIGKLAEGIDLLSKQISTFPAEPGTRTARLHNAIRQAAAHYIKENLLSLGKLPTEAQIEEVRRQRYERAERQIQMERERVERERQRTETVGAGPSGYESRANDVDDDDNPLLEQMNIIRDYIKKAREELKFEEVAILETNLKELKKEYQLEKLSKI